MKKIKWWLWLLVLVMVLPLACVINQSGVAKAAENDELVVTYGQDNIELAQGDFAGVKVSSLSDVFTMLDLYKDSFGFSSSKETFSFNKKIESSKGVTYRLDQLFKGTKVYGGQINVNVKKSGKVNAIIGSYLLNLNVDETTNYSVEDAEAMLKEKYPLSVVTFDEKVIYKDNETSYYAAVFYLESLTQTEKVFVSLRTNKEVCRFQTSSRGLIDSLPTKYKSLENVETTQTNYYGEKIQVGVDKYTFSDGSYYFVLGDSSRNLWITNGQNKYFDEKRNGYQYKYYNSQKINAYFDDVAAVQAFESLSHCYDFYADSSNFGVSINGLKTSNNQTIKLIAIVHYGSQYENAGYSSPNPNDTGSVVYGYFLFGDGNKDNGTGSFVQGLDVVGHEYQHAITSSITPLDYMNAAGAIDEAYSDIFGAFIEGKEMDDPDFWRMGEDLYGGTYAFRDMSAPWIYGGASSYSTLQSFCYVDNHDHVTACDYGGVHTNSSLFTYATYLMYLQDPAFFNKYNILSLWYGALEFLTYKESFTGFANALLLSAQEFPSDKVQMIKNAFASVEIPGYKGIETWNGNNLAPLQGSGTVASPYLINSRSDLASFAYYINEESEDTAYLTSRYKLNADIDLKNVPWVSVGTSERPFNGVFLGNNHKIEGLNLSAPGNTTYCGLFGIVGQSGYITGINIGENSTQTTSQNAGSIVGRLYGGIDSCSSKLSISGVVVGGLVGIVENRAGGSVISSSYYSGNLQGTIVGGIAGKFASGVGSKTSIATGYISGCYADGVYSGTSVGGIVGQANGVGLVNVISLASLSGDTTGGFVSKIQFGNLISSGSRGSNVRNVFISCYLPKADGLTGLIYGQKSGSDSEGTVLAENCVFAGEEKSLGTTQQINNRFSQDEIFEGDFDFDNPKFYNENNFIHLEGLASFDQTTFSYAEKKMPVFGNTLYWINFADTKFTGKGTESEPYLISTAEQLAGLSYLLYSEGWEKYAFAHYELAADIDLAGKVWTGIGITQYLVNETAGSGRDYVDGWLQPFGGVFDGKGHTIFNLTSVGSMIVDNANDRGTSYYLTSFSSALFGVTCGEARIENVTLENVNINGSLASAVVGEAMDSLTLKNVNVIGGEISGSDVTGGLIGRIAGQTSLAYASGRIEIGDCFVDCLLNGRIVGGGVGYALRTHNQTTLTIYNFLFKGTIRATGESSYETAADDYLRPVAGGIVGVALTDYLFMKNCIILGQVSSYNNPSFTGGLVGVVGKTEDLAASNITFEISGCKVTADIGSIYQSESAGVVLGGVHTGFAGTLTINATSANHTSLDYPMVLNNYSGININIDFALSQDEVFEPGDFDYYNLSGEYYSNSAYFDQSKPWSATDIDRMFITITFVYYDGEDIVTKVVRVKNGESIEFIPSVQRQSSAKYDYSFAGWNFDVSKPKHSQTVFAEYDETIRKYVVNYLNEKGEVLDSREIEYGSKIEQDVEAPEKKSNFFFTYRFDRWGEKGQIVEGDLNLKPTYTRSITFFGLLTILGAVVGAMLIVSGIIFASRKMRARR